MQLRTKITFDKGGKWQTLKPPISTNTGKDFRCRADEDPQCSLHLHGVAHATSHARAGMIAMAKKKGGGGKAKKKGGGGKKSGFEWAQSFELKPVESAALREVAELTVSAYNNAGVSLVHVMRTYRLL